MPDLRGPFDRRIDIVEILLEETQYIASPGIVRADPGIALQGINVAKLKPSDSIRELGSNMKTNGCPFSTTIDCELPIETDRVLPQPRLAAEAFNTFGLAAPPNTATTPSLRTSSVNAGNADPDRCLRPGGSTPRPANHSALLH